MSRYQRRRRPEAPYRVLQRTGASISWFLTPLWPGSGPGPAPHYIGTTPGRVPKGHASSEVVGTLLRRTSRVEFREPGEHREGHPAVSGPDGRQPGDAALVSDSGHGAEHVG